jgi:hypothetical protein
MKKRNAIARKNLGDTLSNCTFPADAPSPQFILTEITHAGPCQAVEKLGLARRSPSTGNMLIKEFIA